MKIIIAGSRSGKMTGNQEEKVKEILRENNCSEIVSGRCGFRKEDIHSIFHRRDFSFADGIDGEGERLAVELEIPVRSFPADWTWYGKPAGPLRNIDMAKYADGCILLPGGPGTANMAFVAGKAGLKIWVVE